MLLAVLAALILQTTGMPGDARQLSLGEPQVVGEVDTGKVKGDIVRLAWSTDASELYLQSIERDGRGNVKATHHYSMALAGKSLKTLDREPEWAAAYWTWKSGQASPAAASFKIAVDSEKKTVRSTAAPMGGAMAKGGTADPSAGSTLGDVASAADQTQMQQVYTLKLKGDTIGVWTNEPVMPGVNFSWSPSPLRYLVFAKREGGPLTVVDESGRKQELKGTKAAFVPAWSNDGKRIAWLERKDKKKFDLTIADISEAR